MRIPENLPKSRKNASGLSSLKKTFETAFVYIGLVIGAGFASGREILEYFNFASRTDFTGIILASVFFAIISYIIMSFSEKNNIFTFVELAERVAGRLAPAVKIFLFLYMFCGFFVMLSGSGTLLSRLFRVNGSAGVFLLAALCFVVFVFDIKGIVAVNTVMVPLMICGIVFLCLVSASLGVQVFSAKNTIRGNPLVAALCYASYNTITAGAVLVPLSERFSEKETARSACLAGATLGILIFMVWNTLNLYFADISDADMPLFEIAVEHGKICEIVYSGVLFMSLCTTAVSHGFGILSALNTRNASERAACAAVLCAAAIPFARLGFADLIAYLYTAFGVAGFVWLAMLISAYFGNNRSPRPR